MPTQLNARNERVTVVHAERPLLRLSRPNEGRYVWLAKGREGSLQTAVEMAKLVRHDAVSDEGLERFFVQKVIDARLDSHSRAEDVVEVLFNYVQSIPYVHDPAGSFDSVQDARHTLAKGYGDCDDLSVLLATALALLGYQPRFVLARYKPDTKGFDHVYVDVEIENRSQVSGLTSQNSKPQVIRIALDPCARSHAMGWESNKALEKLTFPIFAGRVSSFGFLAPAAVAGGSAAGVGLSPLTLGLSLIPSLIPILKGLFSRTTQRSEEAARDTWKAQVHDGMLAIQRDVDSCKVTADQGVAAAKQLVAGYYAQCDANFTKKSVAQSCRNAQSEPGGFDAKTAAIAAAGNSCALGGGGGAGASLLTSASGGVNWTMILLIAGGIFLLTRMR